MAEVSFSDDRSGGISVKVCEPQKIGDGITAYVIYKVITSASSDESSQITGTVTRRFKEFFSLFQYLVKLYVPQGHIVVKPPERSVVAMTKLKVLDEHESDNHVNERMYRLETFINKITSHKVIGKDEGVYYFLHENDWSTKLKVNPKKTAFDDLIDKLEEVFPVSLDTSSFEEWFAKSLEDNHNLYIKLEGLRNDMCKLQSDNFRLSSELESFSTACTNLCFSESHGKLAKVFNRYATLVETISGLTRNNSQADLRYLVCNTKDMLAWLRGASLVYKKAILNHLEIEEQKSLLEKKTDALKKEESSASARKIGELKSQIVGIKAVISAIQESQETLMKNFKVELNQLTVARCRQTKQAFLAHLKESLNIEQRILTLWEEFLPVCQEFSASG